MGDGYRSIEARRCGRRARIPIPERVLEARAIGWFRRIHGRWAKIIVQVGDLLVVKPRYRLLKASKT